MVLLQWCSVAVVPTSQIAIAVAWAFSCMHARELVSIFWQVYIGCYLVLGHVALGVGNVCVYVFAVFGGGLDYVPMWLVWLWAYASGCFHLPLSMSCLVVLFWRVLCLLPSAFPVMHTALFVLFVFACYVIRFVLSTLKFRRCLLGCCISMAGLFRARVCVSVLSVSFRGVGRMAFVFWFAAFVIGCLISGFRQRTSSTIPFPSDIHVCFRLSHPRC